MKTLLIMYHSLTGRTFELAKSVCEGACLSLAGEHGDSSVVLSFLHAREVSVAEVLSADAWVICTPENFGYMSGEVKAVFDRTYDATREATAGRAYSLLVSAGNDGSGAVAAMERIMVGYGMKAAREPLIVRGELGGRDLAAAYELGQYMAAALDAGLI